MANQKTNQGGKKVNPAELGLSEILNGIHPSLSQWIKQGLLALIALLALFLVVSQVRASREAKAAKAYAELAEAVTHEDFDRVAAAYPDTFIAQQAQLSAARKLFAEGNHKLAAERFAAAAAGRDEVVALRAMLGQALASEALGQADALQLFATAGNRAATIGLIPEQVNALLGQVRRLSRNGDLAKARELLDTARKLTAANPSLERLVAMAADSLATREFAAAPATASVKAAE